MIPKLRILSETALDTIPNILKSQPVNPDMAKILLESPLEDLSNAHDGNALVYPSR